MTRANNTATSGKTRSSSIFAWSLGAVCILAFVASVVKDCDDCSPTQRQLGKNALGLLTVAAIALISAFAAAFSAGKESQVACGPSELISAQAQLVSALRESLHTQKRLVTMEEEVRESERAATEAQEYAQSLEEEMEEREEESRKEYREREAAPAAGGRAGGSAQAAA